MKSRPCLYQRKIALEGYWKDASAVDSMSSVRCKKTKPVPAVDKYYLGAGIVTGKKSYYERLFASYLDVETLVRFSEMLGGTGGSTAIKLIREDRVQH